MFFSTRALMETDPEEHRLNYERYRTLVMIDYSGGQSINYLLSLSEGAIMLSYNESYLNDQGTKIMPVNSQMFFSELCFLTIGEMCNYIWFTLQRKMFFHSLATEESYLRQLEIEETYGAKKDDDKRSKEK